MGGSSIGYLLREGARNIYANKQMSVAAIGVLVACMLLIGVGTLLMISIFLVFFPQNLILIRRRFMASSTAYGSSRMFIVICFMPVYPS